MQDVSFSNLLDGTGNGPKATESKITNCHFEGNTPAMDQEIVNIIFKKLDDMFLRLFCIGTNKSEIKQLRESGITSIVEIKKSLDSLGLKFRDEI